MGLLLREALGRQHEALEQRGHHLLEPARERGVTLLADEHLEVAAVALGELQDEAHVLGEVEPVALEQAVVHQTGEAS